MTCRLLLVLSITALALPVQAGTLTFYTDRQTWLNDAGAAGLTVTTEAFASEPAAYPDLSVGGIDFTVTTPRAVYDAGNERIGFLSGGGRVLSFDYTGGAGPLFGFGLDLGPTTGNLSTTDADGATLATGGGGVDGHFLGLLGTAPLDPVNPFPTNTALSFGNEFGTSGVALNVHLDNLSVAVPEPATWALLGLALLGLRSR